MKGKTFRAKLTSKNQLTLPAGVSALLHVGPGDFVQFEVGADGVRLSPPPVDERLAPLIGIWRRGEGASQEEIDSYVRDLRGRAERSG